LVLVVKRLIKLKLNICRHTNNPQFLELEKFRFIEQSRKTRINPTVVTTPNSYYVFTTIDGINLPYFAPFRIFVTESGAKHHL